MKISPDDQRSYNASPHCPDIHLSPNHILNCSSILAKLHGPSTALFSRGPRHCKDYFGRPSTPFDFSTLLEQDNNNS
ncbi:hypothetical protein TNCV_4683231 [Trichonephila clavipes]|nr:hypothetical protein TNCV_4683231 [Trichonephila clavipes]